jgi:tight adherence protein B
MALLSSAVFFVVIFVVALIATSVAWMVVARRASEQGLQAAGDSAILRDQAVSTVHFWQTLLSHFDFVNGLRATLLQANLGWSVGRLTLAMLLCGTVALLVGETTLPMWTVPFGAAAAASLPFLYVRSRRAQRQRLFREQFPDALDSLARALRAGYPVSQAISVVAQEATGPLATELRRMSAEANLGTGWATALEGLAERMPVLEVHLFGSALALHAKTGGKLSEVLSDMATNVREGLALESEVRALAAHGRLTGIILTILPVGIAAIMTVVSPEYMRTLYEHPWGKALIAASALCLLAAHWVIGKLVDAVSGEQ